MNPEVILANNNLDSLLNAIKSPKNWNIGGNPWPRNITTLSKEALLKARPEIPRTDPDNNLALNDQ